MSLLLRRLLEFVGCHSQGGVCMSGFLLTLMWIYFLHSGQSGSKSSCGFSNNLLLFHVTVGSTSIAQFIVTFHPGGTTDERCSNLKCATREVRLGTNWLHGTSYEHWTHRVCIPLLLISWECSRMLSVCSPSNWFRSGVPHLFFTSCTSVLHLTHDYVGMVSSQTPTLTVNSSSHDIKEVESLLFQS